VINTLELYVTRITEYRSLYTCLYSTLCYIRQEMNTREKLQYVDKNPDDTKFAVYLLSSRYTKKGTAVICSPRLLVFVLPAGRSVSNSITNSTSEGFLFYVFFIFPPLFYNIVSIEWDDDRTRTKFKKIVIKRIWVSHSV